MLQTFRRGFLALFLLAAVLLLAAFKAEGAPAPSGPEPSCSAETGFRTWLANRYTCSMRPPAVPMSLARLPLAKDGQTFTLRDRHGVIQGDLVMRCRAGVWVPDDKPGKPAATCGKVKP